MQKVEDRLPGGVGRLQSSRLAEATRVSLRYVGTAALAACVANLRHEQGPYTASRAVHAWAPVLAPPHVRTVLAAMGLVTGSICLHAPSSWARIGGARASQVVLATCAGAAGMAAVLFEVLRQCSTTGYATLLDDGRPSYNLFYDFEISAAHQIRGLACVSQTANELLQISQWAACAGALLGCVRGCRGLMQDLKCRRRRMRQINAGRNALGGVGRTPVDASPVQQSRRTAAAQRADSDSFATAPRAAQDGSAEKLLEALRELAALDKRCPANSGTLRDSMPARAIRTHLAALTHCSDAEACLQRAVVQAGDSEVRSALRRGIAAMDRLHQRQRPSDAGVWHSPRSRLLRSAALEWLRSGA